MIALDDQIILLNVHPELVGGYDIQRANSARHSLITDHKIVLMRRVRLTDEHIKFVSLGCDYKFHEFINIGKYRSALVLENERTTQLRFVKPHYCKEDDKITFEQLGLV